MHFGISYIYFALCTVLLRDFDLCAYLQQRT